MEVKRYKPRAEVTFYTETSQLVARATNDPNSRLDDDVVRIVTNRDMGTDVPTFSIDLTRNKPWHKWIAPNDLVIISMVRPPETDAKVFYGLVDDSRKKIYLSEDGVQRVITITGRGLNKAFVNFDVGVVPEAEATNSNIGWLLSNGVKIGGSTAKQILEFTLNLIAKKHINYTWSNTKNLFNSFVTNFKNKANLTLLDESSLVNWQGSLWSFMKEIAEEPFYELFWEITNNTPTLYLRPTPFTKSDWETLPKVSISDEDVVGEDIGRSDIETYTLFSVGAKTLFSSQDTRNTLGIYPLWYPPYFKKYGIKRLNVPSGYVIVAEEKDTTVSTVMKGLQQDIYNWNIKNNSMFNGTLIVKGKNAYKIGNRLSYNSVEDDSTLDFYIKSVTQIFINFGNWTTQLGITRGIKESDRFTAPYGSHTDFKGSGLIKFSANGGTATISGKNTLMPINGEFLVKADALVTGISALTDSGNVTYVFGANNSSTMTFDCSSFVKYAYKTFCDITVGRTTGLLATQGTAVLDKNRLMAGDIVLFKNTYNNIKGASHAGIYIGNNNFIHCSSSAGTLAVSSLTEPYYVEHWFMGRRVLEQKTVASILDSHFRGKLAGEGLTFYIYCETYPVDPFLVGAIAMHETSNGSSNAIKLKNNPGGLMGDNGLMSFTTLDNGIKAMVKNLKDNYIDEGLTTIEQIQKKYAPVGAENDPNNLNEGWITGVKIYHDLLTNGGN